MKYRKFGRLDWQVSVLGFGAMRLPTREGNQQSSQICEGEAIAMIHKAIESGVNYVDTAYPYHAGQSEVVVGKALKQGYRPRVRLATKSPLWAIHSPGDFDNLLDEQLQKLQTDTIDFYLLHAISGPRWRDTVLRFDLFSRAEAAIRAGKIRSLGFSYHDGPESFPEVLAGYDWDFCQLQYNYMDTMSQAGRAGVEMAAKKGLAVIVMEPLLGGRLSNPPPEIRSPIEQQEPLRTASDWALQWLWDQREVTTILSGMTTMKHVEQNLASAGRAGIGSFSPADHEMIALLQAGFRARTKIDCTDCRYCLPCPEGVKIPENFSTYNGAFLYDDLAGARKNYQLFLGEGKASACTACRECEPKCPQAIEISEWMPKVHQLLGG